MGNSLIKSKISGDVGKNISPPIINLFCPNILKTDKIQQNKSLLQAKRTLLKIEKAVLTNRFFLIFEMEENIISLLDSV